MHCNELQHMVDIDVTAAHVEKVAQQIKGEPAPGGTLQCIGRIFAQAQREREKEQGILLRGPLTFKGPYEAFIFMIFTFLSYIFMLFFFFPLSIALSGLNE